MIDALSGRHVLMLQGPAGPFFRRVATQLRRRDATITKVNFNSGDDLYFQGPEVVPFRGAFGEWPKFLAELVRRRGIEAVVLFGDCRALHRIAVKFFQDEGLEVWVFEEGYLRPDYVTLERDGVAGFSRMPKDPEFYRKLKPGPVPTPTPVGSVMPKMAWYATVYACTNGMMKWRYPHYRHHRNIRPFEQAGLWVKGAARRVMRTPRDRLLDERIARGALPPFFLVPLQVHLDTQMQHCPFDSVEEFIRAVVRSFAQNAPIDSALLVKDHPLGRPYKDYGSLIKELRERYQLANRLRYVDVIHLPSALKVAKGTVVINSTVGLSSIHHKTPVKCMGKAVYDMPGMTFQGELDEFWHNPGEVDHELYQHFRWWLLENNQINGSVWKELYV